MHSFNNGHTDWIYIFIFSPDNLITKYPQAKYIFQAYHKTQSILVNTMQGNDIQTATQWDSIKISKW